MGTSRANQSDPDEEAMIRCLNWTPLHVAASRGFLMSPQTNLWISNPELAEARDSQQRTVLHLASANGNFFLVRDIYLTRPEMCLARDRDGANPLHLAAMRGKVQVLDVLIEANPHAARARLDTGESVLHLCVKYNQLQSLRMLLVKYFEGKELLDAVDNDGNTILHLAVANRNFKIVRYLLCFTRISINEINANKQTAMDVLLLRAGPESQLAEEDQPIHDLLKCFGGKKEIHVLFDPARDSDRRNGVMVSAALFATLAFQIGAAPPGGVWQDDNDGHESGKAVMATHYPALYQVLLCCNVVGFTSSFLTITLIWLNLLYKVGAYIHMVSVAMGVSILFIAATYGISLFVVSPEEQLGKVNLLVEIFIPFILTVAFFPLVYWIARCWEQKRGINRSRVKQNFRDEANKDINKMEGQGPSKQEVDASPEFEQMSFGFALPPQISFDTGRPWMAAYEGLKE